MTAQVRLTPVQIRVLDYLYRSGWASGRNVAFMLYSDRRQTLRAVRVLERMEARGLIETHLVHQGTHRAWQPTKVGRSLAQEQIVSGAVDMSSTDG